MLSACATYQGAKTDVQAAVAGATPAPKLEPTQVQSLLDKLINEDAPAAIARAQKEIDNPKTSAEEVIYAQKRIVCYQAIVSIAPNFTLLNITSPGQSAGVLDLFEISAEAVEGVAAVKLGLAPVDRAKFETSCGWIGQRTIVIANQLGLRLARVAADTAILLPK